MPRADRVELWNESHEVLREFVLNPETSDSLKSSVSSLRRMYDSMAKGEISPKFSLSELRDAYMVAYHPGHTFMAHYVFDTNQYVGQYLDVFGGREYTVTVLGAGCGAETLALLKWLQNLPETLMERVVVHLVDIQDWSRQRGVGFYPLVDAHIERGFLVVNEYQVDVCSASGRQLIKELVPSSDLVICPALMTELPSDAERRTLLTDLSALLDRRARLVLLDQSQVNNFDQFVGNARQMQKVAVLGGGRFALGIQDPIPQWLSTNVLNGSDGLIPRTKYTWSWLVCQSPEAD